MTMHLMSEPVFEDRMQLRTTGASKGALDRIVANLRASGRVRWKGRKVTQEAVLNAVWLWLEDLDPAEVERAFGTYVPRLEAIMRGEPSAEATSGGLEVADEVAPAASRPGREKSAG